MCFVQTILRDQPARGLWDKPGKNKQKTKIQQIILWVVYGFAVWMVEDEMKQNGWETSRGNIPNKGTLTRRYIGYRGNYGCKLFRAFIGFLRDIHLSKTARQNKKLGKYEKQNV